mmetsp:Transcript_8183/g.29030  ORF Transcript_8183/g.29030 Transcript_8183/m.29030 type:complete len:140 (+) Transcript_8183:1160-1579(+)
MLADRAFLLVINAWLSQWEGAEAGARHPVRFHRRLQLRRPCFARWSMGRAKDALCIEDRPTDEPVRRAFSPKHASVVSSDGRVAGATRDAVGRGCEREHGGMTRTWFTGRCVESLEPSRCSATGLGGHEARATLHVVDE